MTAEPERLKRESAGRYTSTDGRFTIEQSSGRWLSIDAEATDELGLPLVRGPFATLDEARSAITIARTAPPVASTLAEKIAASGGRRRTTSARPKRVKPREPVVALRDFEPADGEALRLLWRKAGFHSTGDDDRSLIAFADRNPGLFLVATADGSVIGSALGGWDGRRGWIYHVAMAETFRRKGIATRLVRRLEQRMKTAGAPKVNAVVRDENESARAFWEALGYEMAPTRPFGRTL